MAYEQKDNSGSLFINDKREKDTHPNRKGSIRVAGKDYWISAWDNVSKDGKEWISLSVQEKDAAHSAGIAKVQKAVETQPAQPGFTSADFDDEIGF